MQPAGAIAHLCSIGGPFSKREYASAKVCEAAAHLVWPTKIATAKAVVLDLDLAAEPTRDLQAGSRHGPRSGFALAPPVRVRHQLSHHRSEERRVGKESRDL